MDPGANLCLPFLQLFPMYPTNLLALDILVKSIGSNQIAPHVGLLPADRLFTYQC